MGGMGGMGGNLVASKDLSTLCITLSTLLVGCTDSRMVKIVASELVGRVLEPIAGAFEKEYMYGVYF